MANYLIYLHREESRMSLEKLRAGREQLRKNSDITLNNMQKLADESSRVADVAHHSRKILDDLDR